MSAETLRIDKWLWHARFFKSRTTATGLCAAGRVRVNEAIVRKAHFPVKPGDVLTFAAGRSVRVVRIVALGTRRGPAPEARSLYEDLTPQEGPETSRSGIHAPAAERSPGTGRPTKAERRATDRLRGDL